MIYLWNANNLLILGWNNPFAKYQQDIPVHDPIFVRFFPLRLHRCVREPVYFGRFFVGQNISISSTKRWIWRIYIQQWHKNPWKSTTIKKTCSSFWMMIKPLPPTFFFWKWPRTSRESWHPRLNFPSHSAAMMAATTKAPIENSMVITHAILVTFSGG